MLRLKDLGLWLANAADGTAQQSSRAKLGHNPFWNDPQDVAAVTNSFLLHGN